MPDEKENQNMSSENPSSSTGNMGGASMNGDGMKKDMKGILGQIENLLNEYMVVKAPFQLPMSVKEIIVKIIPYLTLIFALLALPLVLAAFGITAFFTPLAMMGGYSWGIFGMISLLFIVAKIVLELMAVSGLFHRKERGWRLLFYASLVSLVGSFLTPYALVSAIIGAIIGWYFLFQIKAMYTN